MIDSRTLIILADYKYVSTVGVVTFLLVWVDVMIDLFQQHQNLVDEKFSSWFFFACFLSTKFGGWGKIIWFCYFHSWCEKFCINARMLEWRAVSQFSNLKKKTAFYSSNFSFNNQQWSSSIHHKIKNGIVDERDHWRVIGKRRKGE